MYYSIGLFMTENWRVYTFQAHLLQNPRWGVVGGWVVDDILNWQLTQKGVFDVCSFYNSLLDAPFVSFPWKSIWCVKLSKRVSFFLWISS